MENDATFQYLKLFMDYFPFWALLLAVVLVLIVRNPSWLKSIPNYVSSAKIGEFEIQLRQVEEKLAETETHVIELEEENLRLNQLYSNFDAHAPVGALAHTRQELKALAGNMDDLAPALAPLQFGADPADVYAAAEILRAKRDYSAFDTLIEALDRISSDDELEGLRYHTVWTLASAVHRTVLSAVKHSDQPKLSKGQLEMAKQTMQKLQDNPHVQLDSPGVPNQGIRGPASYALNWIDQGLKKFETIANLP